MKRTVLMLLVTILVVGGLAAWFVSRPSGPHAIVLKVSGPAGIKVSATLDADGTSSTEEKLLPCEFNASANKLVFDITKLGGVKGIIDVQVFADGEMRNRTSGDEGVDGRLEFAGRKVIESSITGR